MSIIIIHVRVVIKYMYSFNALSSDNLKRKIELETGLIEQLLDCLLSFLKKQIKHLLYQCIFTTNERKSVLSGDQKPQATDAVTYMSLINSTVVISFFFGFFFVFFLFFFFWLLCILSITFYTLRNCFYSTSSGRQI